MISIKFAIIRAVLSVIVFVSGLNQTSCCSRSDSNSSDDKTIKGKRYSGNDSCLISDLHVIVCSY